MAGELDKMLSQLFKVMDVKRIWDHGAAAEKFLETVANAPGVESVTITSGDHSVTIKAGDL